jgi:hypothetical protein
MVHKGIERKFIMSSNEIPSTPELQAPTQVETTPVVTVWNALKSRLARPEPRPDYGTGYYVRSTAHPVVGGPDLPLEVVYEALNAVDETYAQQEEVG